MLILKQENLTFIHIPKCAGLSVKKAIFDNFEKKHIESIHGRCIFKDSTVRDCSHLTIEELKEHLPDIFNFVKSSEIYCTIRNPFKRFLSAYFFEIKKNRWQVKNSLLEEDLLYFLDSVIESYEKKIFVFKNSSINSNIRFFDWRHRHAMPQTIFIKDNDIILPKKEHMFDVSEKRHEVFMKNKPIKLVYGNFMLKSDKFKCSKFKIELYPELYKKIFLFYKDDFDLLKNSF